MSIVVDNFAKASRKLKEVVRSERPKDETNFVQNNQIKELSPYSDDSEPRGNTISDSEGGEKSS